MSQLTASRVGTLHSHPIANPFSAQEYDMASVTRSRSTTAAIGLSLAAVFTLSACANPLDGLVENVVSGGVENLIEDQLGEDVDISVPGTGGGTLPSSWPADVPTPDGEIVFSLAAAGNYSATILVSDQGVVDAVYGQLESAGYSLTTEADFGGLLSRIYENDTYTVSVGSVPDEETGDISVQYSIIEKTQ